MVAYTLTAVSRLLSHLLGHVTGLALLLPIRYQSVCPRNNRKRVSQHRASTHTHVPEVVSAVHEHVKDKNTTEKNTILILHMII